MSSRFIIQQHDSSKESCESVVGLAVYHGDKEEWVSKAIGSIIEQTYTDFVLAIVMDGEISLGLRSLIQRFADSDSRIVLIKSERNVGLAACMNFVIDWSINLKATFFFRMDADDVSHLDRLERQVHYLKAHHNVAVLGSALTEINEVGERVGKRVMPGSHKKIIAMLPRRCPLNHPTVAIRYEVFRQGFRYESSLKNTQDYFFWISLAKEGYIFRNLKDSLLDFRRVNNFYKRRGISKSLNEFKARFYAMWHLKRLSPYSMIYACGVLCLRLLPSPVVKLAYKVDRILLEKFVRH